MKKLFVIDLDGTALLNFVTLHPKTIEGVAHLMSLGHKVVIATGRSECACIKFYEELGLDTPLITSNGAVLRNPKDDNFKGWSLTVAPELINYILSSEIIENIENMYYYANGKVCVHEYHELLIEKLLMTGCEVEVIHVEDASNINSIALVVKNDMLQEVRNNIKNNFENQDFNSWDGNYHESYVEVNPDNSNKWLATLEVAKHFGIDKKNIYTFGDANNDYMMIKECENGIAMKNATHKLQSVASVVLDMTNEEGAVGEYMLSIKE